MRQVSRFLGECTRDPLMVPGQELQALPRLAGRPPDPGLVAAAEYHVMPDYYRMLHASARGPRDCGVEPPEYAPYATLRIPRIPPSP